MSASRTTSTSSPRSGRTCMDVACVGVHPSVVAALLQYRSALKVYDTTVSNSRGPSPSSPSSSSAARAMSPSSGGARTAGVAGASGGESSPLKNNSNDINNNNNNNNIAHDLHATPHASVTGIRNRLLLDITADYVCEKAFRQLFVDHKNYPLQMEKPPPSTAAAGIKAATSSSSLDGGESTTNNNSNDDAALSCASPCSPLVKGPRNAKEFVTINTQSPNMDLTVDDMLWIVDNRKAPSAHSKALSAWQDHYKSSGGAAAMPPPPTTTPPAGSSSHGTASGSSSPSAPKPPSSSSPSSSGNSGIKGPNMNIHTISPAFPLSPSAIGTANAAQIILHRRNVMLTREYFATAAAAESDYRVAVQDLVPPPPPQQQQQQQQVIGDNHHQHTLASPPPSSPYNSFVPIGGTTAAAMSPKASLLSDGASPPPSRHHQQQNGGRTESTLSTSAEQPFSSSDKNKKEKESSGGFGKFMKAFSKAINSKDDQNNNNNKNTNNEKEGDNTIANDGNTVGGSSSAVDTLAASASSVAAAIGRFTTKIADSAAATVGSGNAATGYRIGGTLISEHVGLPPIAWRETLALNIITQWTYTLTIAVVKLVTVTVPLNPSSSSLSRATSTANSAASSPLGNTTKHQQPAATTTINKELIVVRHISKRVYAQPTKAMFQTKEHRGESGDKMDYPNIYFNVDDFEDEDLFKDIKLCEGYTFAVLLTAGATRNSNATIFRGALSYDVVMERIRRNAERSGGKNLPIAPSSSGVSNASFNDALTGKTGASFVMGTEYLLKNGGGGGGGTGSSASYGDSYTPKMFIPLVGPERKGKAELAVCISEAELFLSSQNSSFVANQQQQASHHHNHHGGGDGALIKDNYDHVQPAAKSASFSPPSHSPYSPKPSSLVDKEKDGGGGGLFGRFLNKVKSSDKGSSADGGSGGVSSSAASAASSASGQQQQYVLQGNEAIQCCLTFVSVHAQHVMDVLMSQDPERSRQWLSYYDTQEEITKALASAS